jgi:phage baseplate assembly protein W
MFRDFNTKPFYGQGIAFPFRIDPNTGGVKITSGNTEYQSVALAYLMDKFTIREETGAQDNHIAEAIGNIIYTRKLEHDTLPEYGSNTTNLLFEPNTFKTMLEFEAWISIATKRWEKRAEIPLEGGMEWRTTEDDVEQGISRLILKPMFVEQQEEGNLVSPFVTEREARLAEYPSGSMDVGGHDWLSRYKNRPTRTTTGVDYIRNRTVLKSSCIPQKNDMFYKVKGGDSWLLASWEMYGDIRFWWILVDFYVYDAGEAGASRSHMDNTSEPEQGDTLRGPSKSRLLSEIIT